MIALVNLAHLLLRPPPLVRRLPLPPLLFLGPHRQNLLAPLLGRNAMHSLTSRSVAMDANLAANPITANVCKLRISMLDSLKRSSMLCHLYKFQERKTKIRQKKARIDKSKLQSDLWTYSFFSSSITCYHTCHFGDISGLRNHRTSLFDSKDTKQRY